MKMLSGHQEKDFGNGNVEATRDLRGSNFRTVGGGGGGGGRCGSGEDQVEGLKKSMAWVKMEKITILF